MVHGNSISFVSDWFRNKLVTDNLAYETERKPAKEASEKFSVVFKIHAKKDVSSEAIGYSVS